MEDTLTKKQLMKRTKNREKVMQILYPIFKHFFIFTETGNIESLNTFFDLIVENDLYTFIFNTDNDDFINFVGGYFPEFTTLNEYEQEDYIDEFILTLYKNFIIKTYNDNKQLVFYNIFKYDGIDVDVNYRTLLVYHENQKSIKSARFLA